MRKLNIKKFVEQESQIIGDEIKELIKNHSIPNKIVFIRVGNDPASISYMKSKSNQLTEAGLTVEDIVFTDEVGLNFSKVANKINELNRDDSVLGVLVQSPVPGLSSAKYNELVSLINFNKDLDAFGDQSVLQQVKSPVEKDKKDIYLYPCTPLGILYFLSKIEYNLAGKKVAIIGRSDIVGKPLALAMLNSGAIVSVFNSNMPIDQINEHISEDRFNIIISAIGRPELVKIKRSMTRSLSLNELDYVFDVGINRVKDLNEKKGYRLVGDIEHIADPEYTDERVYKSNYRFTPVPGGVGLLTRLGLLLRAKRLMKLRIPGDSLED